MKIFSPEQKEDFVILKDSKIGNCGLTMDCLSGSIKIYRWDFNTGK